MLIDFTTPNGKLTIDQTVINSLRYMGTLTILDLSNVPEPLHRPLNRLYELACKRIREGGRQMVDPDELARMLNEPGAADWVRYRDIKHTAEAFSYLVEICNGENFSWYDQIIALSAIAVHDCGYPIANAQTFQGARENHMVIGEQKFREFAQIINEEFQRNVYDSNSIDQIAAIVKQHDNPSVKPKDGGPLPFKYDPPDRKLLWAHREADRLCMLDRAGFAEDLFVKLVSDPKYDPEQGAKKYLKHVISRHVEESQVYHKFQDNENCILINENWFDFRGEKTLYRTQTGFKTFLRLVKERAVEYGIDLRPTK